MRRARFQDLHCLSLFTRLVQKRTGRHQSFFIDQSESRVATLLLF